MRRIYLAIVCLFFYFVSFAGNKVAVPANGINWITVWLGFLFGVLFTMLFRFLNRRTKIIDQRSNAGQPMNGWVIFLGICLVVRLIVQAYFFWRASYFMKQAWTNLELAGGVMAQSLFIFEMFLSLFALSGTGALLYWFFGKRDIFPVMFIYYVGLYLISNLILLIIYHDLSFPAEMIATRYEVPIQIARISIGAAWAAFVIRSKRVKQTFVYPPG